MKKLLIAFLALPAVLALAAPALAKEPKEAKLCGSDGCASVTDRQLVAGLFVNGDSGPPPPPGPYYTATLTIDVPPTESVPPQLMLWYVPSGHMLRSNDPDNGPLGSDGWIKLGPAASAAFDQAVKGIEPFRAPKPTSVTIGQRKVDDPASYLKLYTVPDQGFQVPSSTDWQQISFAGPSSPWTTNANLQYLPADNLLMRDGALVRLPDKMARKVEAGQSLASGGSSSTWPYVVAVAVLLAAAGGAAVLRRVLRRGPQPALES